MTPSGKTANERRFLPGLTRANLATELLAGVTLLALSVPLNIGYAQIAGLPPQAGLYALIVPSILFALFASSRQLVAAPDAAGAALVSSSLVGLATVGSENYAAMAAAQAILSGVMFLLCGRLRLGFLANFLSKPILIGFVAGMACEILLSQLVKMLGLPRLASEEFFEKAAEIITRLAEANTASTLLSLGAVVVLAVGRLLARRVPWALAVMVAGTVLSAAFSLPQHGVAVLGQLPAGLSMPSVPMLSVAEWIALVPSALALTAITVAEGLMLARTYSEQQGYPNRPNANLSAFGLANIGAGLVSSFSVGSSTSRSAAMVEAGSRSQLPALVLAAGSLILLLFGTELLAGIPTPVIGAIVAVAVFRLLGVTELRELWRLSRVEFCIAAACLLGVLILGPIGGLLIAFVFALINLARRASSATVHMLADPDSPELSVLRTADQKETAPGILVMRFAAPLFFANAAAFTDEVLDAVRRAPHPVHTVIFTMEAVTDIDVTGGAALARLNAQLDAQGITVATSRVRDDLRERFARLELFARVPEFETNRDALATARRPGWASSPNDDLREKPR